MSMSSPPIVLVVEDEPLLRLFAVDVIQEAGYETLEAADADEAVRILERRTDIRVVFTDIDMPGSMDGMKLAAAIRGRWPPVELIITSGQVIPLPADLPERGVFLSKPYDAARLINAISDFLR